MTTNCLGLGLDCATLAKGGLAVAMAFVIFIGSVYMLLAAVFGRRMGFMVLWVGFFGWMILFSGLWAFGAPGTPRNLGPRGLEPAWQPLSGSFEAQSTKYPVIKEYPNSPWEVPPPSLAASIQSATGTFQKFMAENANEQLGLDPTDLHALPPTAFSVEGIEFATADDGTPLAGAVGFYTNGGPEVTLFAYHDSGSVPRYSIMFFVGSILGLGLGLPVLDREEKKRKEILTGGSAPPWFGPA